MASYTKENKESLIDPEEMGSDLKETKADVAYTLAKAGISGIVVSVHLLQKFLVQYALS